MLKCNGIIGFKELNEWKLLSLQACDRLYTRRQKSFHLLSLNILKQFVFELFTDHAFLFRRPINVINVLSSEIKRDQLFIRFAAIMNSFVARQAGRQDLNAPRQGLSPLLVAYFSFSLVFFFYSVRTYSALPNARDAPKFSIPKIEWRDIPTLHGKEPEALRPAQKPADSLDDSDIEQIDRISSVKKVNKPVSECAELIRTGIASDQLPSTCTYAAHQAFNEQGLPHGYPSRPTQRVTAHIEAQ